MTHDPFDPRLADPPEPDWSQVPDVSCGADDERFVPRAGMYQLIDTDLYHEAIRYAEGNTPAERSAHRVRLLHNLQGYVDPHIARSIPKPLSIGRRLLVRALRWALRRVQ